MSMSDDFMRKIDEAINSQASDSQRLREENALKAKARRVSANDDAQREVNALQTHYDALVAVLQDCKSELINQDAKLKTLEEQVLLEKQELEETAERDRDAFTVRLKEHDQQIKERDSHIKKQEQRIRELEKTEKDRTQKLTDQDQQHTRKVDGLRRDVEKLGRQLQEMSEIADQREKTMQTLRDDHKDSLACLQQQHSAEIRRNGRQQDVMRQQLTQELRQAHQSAHAQRSKLLHEHHSELHSLQEEFDIQLQHRDTQINELHDETKSLNEKIGELTAEKEWEFRRRSGSKMISVSASQKVLCRVVERGSARNV